MYSLKIDVDRVRADSTRRGPDDVAVEEPLEIQICSATEGDAAARSVSVTMRTPGHDVELALGFLVSESIIREARDVKDAALVGNLDEKTGLRNTVRIELETGVEVDLESLSRHFYTTSSCGVCGKASLDALRVSAPELRADRFSITAERLIDLPASLRQRQAVFEETGGLHAAAAFDAQGELLLVREDVGRHNAMDKVIGALLREGRLPANDLGLLVSGRASFELMQKALVGGIPMLAAVSAPSSLAVALAQEYSLTLVGFLRGEGYNVYSGNQRIQR